MTARIELIDGPAGASVRLSGRFDEPAARELLELCHRHPGRLTLDLEELISLDQAAVETLQDLRAAGARIEGASRYIQMKLNGRPDTPAVETDFHKEDE